MHREAKAVQYREPKPFPKAISREGQSRNADYAQAGKLISETVKDKPHRQLPYSVSSVKSSLGQSKIRASTPPSKPDFRIQKKVNPNKLRDALIQLNRDEEQLQKDLIRIHNEVEASLKSTATKNKLHLATLPKGKFSDTQESEKLIQLRDKLKRNREAVVTLQEKIESNAFEQFLKTRIQDIFEEERQSEQEADIVEQLPREAAGEGYGRIMPSIKDKKWGLNQRTTYDVHKDLNGNSRVFSQAEAEVENQPEMEDGHKIVVNSHLKNLLFD